MGELEESGSRSILRKMTELAPVLSLEAHTVNQLSKNMYTLCHSAVYCSVDSVVTYGLRND